MSCFLGGVGAGRRVVPRTAIKGIHTEGLDTRALEDHLLCAWGMPLTSCSTRVRNTVGSTQRQCCRGCLEGRLGPKVSSIVMRLCLRLRAWFRGGVPTHSLPRSSGSPAEAALAAQAQGRGSQTRCRDLTHLCVLVHGAKGLHLPQRARFFSLPTLGPR